MAQNSHPHSYCVIPIRCIALTSPLSRRLLTYQTYYSRFWKNQFVSEASNRHVFPELQSTDIAARSTYTHIARYIS